MRYLLDTHTFLWAAAGSPELSDRARRILTDPKPELFLSVASAWEMAIKVSLGKLILARPLAAMLSEGLRGQGIHLLAVHLDHVLAVARLPFHHRDPFDRLIIAQAVAEELVVVGRDEVFDRYGVRREW